MRSRMHRFEFEIHGLNPEMTDEEFKEISNASMAEKTAI